MQQLQLVGQLLQLAQQLLQQQAWGKESETQEQHGLLLLASQLCQLIFSFAEPGWGQLASSASSGGPYQAHFDH